MVKNTVVEIFQDRVSQSIQIPAFCQNFALNGFFFLNETNLTASFQKQDQSRHSHLLVVKNTIFCVFWSSP